MEAEHPTLDLYCERILAERTVEMDQSPYLQHFDHMINGIGGSTFAIDLQPHVVQAQKRLPRPTFEQRLVEMVKETSRYKRELQFFRTAYQAIEDFQDGVLSVIQQLVLNHYLCSSTTTTEERQWLHLAGELETLLQRYTHVINVATEDWIKLVQQQSKHDSSEKF